MQAYIHGKTVNADGVAHSFYTREVKVALRPLEHHKRGLSFTATGYGKKIPTPYIVRFNDKWRRVYCCVYSNTGTCYIGNLNPVGEVITVDIHL